MLIYELGDYMQEAEVSLKIAIYHIINGLTTHDITVSIDGAHIKIKDTIHFDICKFFEENHISKISGRIDDYKGIYRIGGYDVKIIVTSTPGIGDVNVILNDGMNLYIESKKGKANKSGKEYPLMREAIGQLMTGCELENGIIPVYVDRDGDTWMKKYRITLTKDNEKVVLGEKDSKEEAMLLGNEMTHQYKNDDGVIS